MKKKEIAKRTGCTKEQAGYLKEEFKNLPKVSNVFYNNIDRINLYDVDELKIVRVCGYMDDEVNIAAWRVFDEILGVKLRRLHLYHLSNVDGERFSYEVL